MGLYTFVFIVMCLVTAMVIRIRDLEEERADEEKRAAAAGGGNRQHGFSEAAPLAGPGEAGAGMANAARWTVDPCKAPPEGVKTKGREDHF